jgi:hypothetical protein
MEVFDETEELVEGEPMFERLPKFVAEFIRSVFD